MLNVSLTDSGACQLIYGHPWNCLSDAWRGWLTNSGRVNKRRRPDKRERGRGRHKEGDEEGEPLGWTRRMRVTPRKHGRHLLICPEDTRPDTSYFIWLFCCLSEDLDRWTRKFYTYHFQINPISAPFLSRCCISCLFKVCFSMFLQATKALMWHLSSVISLHRVCPYFALSLSQLRHQASTPFVSISCHCFHLALRIHSILRPAAPSSDIKTCTHVHTLKHTPPAAPQHVLQPHIPP